MRVVNTYMPALSALGDAQAAVLAVLVERDDNLTVVYEAIIPWPRRASLSIDKAVAERAKWAEEVARRGTKLPYRKAVCYFPGLRQEFYAI